MGQATKPWWWIQGQPVQWLWTPVPSSAPCCHPQTHTQTHTQRHTHYRHTHRHIDTDTHTHIHRVTDTHRHTHTHTKIHRYTHTHTTNSPWDLSGTEANKTCTQTTSSWDRITCSRPLECANMGQFSDYNNHNTISWGLNTPSIFLTLYTLQSTFLKV